MRRRAVVLLALLLVSACGSAGASGEHEPAGEPAEPIGDVVALQDASGTIAVGDDVVGQGRIADDGALAITTRPDGGETVVEWRATATGALDAAVRVAGAFDLAATDPAGERVALVSAAEPPRDGTIAPARSRSELVVVDRTGERFRREYAGNLVPEGFASFDAEGAVDLPALAYVLEYTPAAAPTHYRVRTLTLPSGELGLPWNLRDKTRTVDQVMAGISRSQLLAARDGLLFTLYRGHHDEGHGSYAFVHTLGLANGVWCLVVPVEMELAVNPGALATTPAGDELVVASANGTVAKIPLANVTSPDLPPTFAPPVDVGVAGREPPALATGAGALWLGLGRTLLRLDPVTLAVQDRAESPVVVEAIAERADGTVVVAGEGRLVELSPSLTVVRTAAVDERLGVLQRVVTAPRTA